MNCFDNLKHENIDNCPNDETASGISIRIQYIPAAYVETMTLPSNNTSFEESISIAANGITLKTGKGWKGIDLLTDENELKELLVGNKGNKKPKVQLDAFIPGFKPKVLGWKKQYKNVPLILNVSDSEGRNWIVGTKYNPTHIDSGDSTTGKGYEDNSGTPISFVANTALFLYKGDIVETPDTTTTSGGTTTTP